jgi:DNA-binding response OmpR family regulator
MAYIIVADDDEIMGEIVLDGLLGAGHDARLVTDGAQALQAVETRRPDLLILDCNMPGLSGLSVLRAVRTTPDLKGLPVMMLTGRRSPQDANLATLVGADAYVTKPFDPDDLITTIENLLEGSAHTH